jgi:glycosyltransferase involved in cell wall biosynthesis
MKISICLLTYNRSSLLKNLLLSIENLKYDPMEIIVIDNCSEDNTQQMMMHEFHYVNYVRTEKNIGAAARNLGLKRAAGDIVVTLDDDIIGVTDAHLNILKEYFYLRANLGAINFKVLEYGRGEKIDEKDPICIWNTT